MLLHAAQRSAPTTGHVNRTLCQRSSPIRRRHVDNIQAAEVHAEMAHLLEEAVMRGGAQRHGHFLARQFTGAVGVDLQIGTYNAVVIVGITHRHIDNLQILPGRGGHNKRGHALADRDLNIARCHRRAHRGAGVKAHPVDRHPKRFVIGAGDLGVLERHRPFEEIANGQLFGFGSLRGHDQSNGGDRAGKCTFRNHV